MKISKIYIQQLEYDGVEYTQGPVIDLLSSFRIACEEMPFVLYPKAKDVVSRDWVGSDGQDVYVPKQRTLQKYDIEAKFLYVGTENTIHTDIKNFIDFLYGRNVGALGGRLAVYDEYVKIGRKDVVVTEVGNELYHYTGNDVDAIARFKIKFTVYDPSTDVIPTYQDDTIISFTF